MAKIVDLTGQKFGMLTVTKRAENDGRRVVWYCDCDCGTTDFLAYGSDLKGNRVKSCGCKSIDDIIEEKKKKAKSEKRKNAKKMTEEEKREFKELYKYVKVNIMNYNDDQSLSNKMTLRLKGLSTNKFVENNNIEDSAKYSYQTILNTFKFCSQTIQNSLRTNNFVDEMHKFNFVLKIVESHINDVYVRMKNIERAKKEAENTFIEIDEHTGVEYQPKKKRKNRLMELW